MSAKGVRCPQCHCGHTTVVKTVPKEVKWNGILHIHTRRYRVCERCGNSWTTVELVEDDRNLGFPPREAQPDKPKPPKVPPRNPLAGTPREEIPENPFLKRFDPDTGT